MSYVQVANLKLNIFTLDNRYLINSCEGLGGELVTGHMLIPGTQSISRALELIELLVQGPRSLEEIRSTSGLTRATTVRLLNVLEQYGYIRRATDGRIDLGIRFLELSACVQSRIDPATAAAPYLQALARRFGETTYLCVRDGRDIICVARLESPQAIRLSHSVGARTAPHAGALGKALLAFAPASIVEAVLSAPLERFTARTITDPVRLRAELEAICSTGFAESDGEASDGASAVAAPIRDSTGEVIAAIAVAGPSPRFRMLPRADVCDEVMEAAAAISAELGWRGDTSAAGSAGVRSLPGGAPHDHAMQS